VIAVLNTCQKLKKENIVQSRILMPLRTAVMQLMDQGVTNALKSYYLHPTLKKLTAESGANNEFTVHEF
jgi:hypothetical protein